MPKDNVSLVDQISNATSDDLREIEAEIAKLEGEQAALQNRIDALKNIRRVVNIAINGKPARAPRGSKKKGGATSAATAGPVDVAAPPEAPQVTTADAEPSPLETKLIAEIKKTGPATAATLAMRCGATPAAVNRMLETSRFFIRMTSGTIKLSGMA